MAGPFLQRAFAFGWSADDSGESEPAKSPVPARNAVMPAPDPTLVYETVACAQLTWYSRIQALTAFACAVEPWPWMDPDAHAIGSADAGGSEVPVQPASRSSITTAAVTLIGTPAGAGGPRGR